MACHIHIKNLALTFRWKEFQKDIFEDLNLCIPRGSFVTLIGGNGCGKSSLIELILGLVQQQNGEILVNDTPVRAGYPDAIKKHQIAYLSQQIEDLFFSETVGEELSYQGASLSDDNNVSILRQLGLEQFLHRSVESLSGGERQALALAQFMMSPAGLLILDEPSSYLDQDRASLLKSYLQQAHQSGRTILHATQFLSELEWGTHVLKLDEATIGLETL